MNRIAFKNKVVEHPDLEFIGMPLPTDEVVVKRITTDGDFFMAIPWDDIPNHEWDEYEPVLMGLENGHILEHWSRVIGYFSAEHRWNKSKQAEARDRHNGNYALPEPATEVAPA